MGFRGAGSGAIGFRIVCVVGFRGLAVWRWSFKLGAVQFVDHGLGFQKSPRKGPLCHP